MKERGARWMRVSGRSARFLLSCLLVLLLAQSASAQESADTDSDGMPDDWENTYGLNATDPGDALYDNDSDNLTNIREYEEATSPLDPDSDDDGMPDGWEVRYGLDPRDPSDALFDKDSDGLSNKNEFQRGTDPLDAGSPNVTDDDITPPKEEGEAGALNSFVILFCFVVLGSFVVLLLIVGFYTKLKKERLLDHETRQRIMDFIREHPGTYYSQMRRDLGLVHGVLTHHLNMLETQELIFSKQDQQFRRFYVDGMHAEGPLVTGSRKTVLDAVRRHPGSSQSELGRRLGISRMIVSYHVTSLEELGLVEKRAKGRESLVYPVNGNSSTEGMGPVRGPAPDEGGHLYQNGRDELGMEAG